MNRTRTRLLAAAAATAIGLATAGSASASLNFTSNYKFPSGFPGFALTAHTNDFTGGVRVGFNLLPAVQDSAFGDGSVVPADPTRLDLDNAFRPVFGAPDNGLYGFLIALLCDGSVMPADPAAAPNNDGFTRYHQQIGDHAFDITFQFGGSEVTSWSWGAFNPQPDPPGDAFGGKIGFGGDPFMGISMNIDGEAARFTLDGVPEPGTWTLLIGGFLGAGAMLRRARRLGLASA